MIPLLTLLELELKYRPINARDPRAQLNLAYTFHLRGEFDAALASRRQ